MLCLWSHTNSPICPQLFDYLPPTIAIMTNPSRDDLREHEGGPELSTTRRFGGRRTRRSSLCDCCRSGPGDRLAAQGAGDELRIRRLPCRDCPVNLMALPSADTERGGGAFCSTIGCFPHIRTCHFNAHNAVRWPPQAWPCFSAAGSTARSPTSRLVAAFRVHDSSFHGH